MKLHAKKSQLYTTKAKWCGRIIDKDGVSHDPKRLKALQELNHPTTGADLQQFICAVNWLQMTLPNYAQTVTPIHKYMERVYEKAKGRSKKKVKQVKLKELGWGEEEEKSWEAVKGMLMKSITLAHPDPKQIICVFTDASEDYWGAVVTQIPPEDLHKRTEEQKHEILALLSHSFKGSQQRWAIVEKEAYAIVATCTRLDYLLIREGGFQLYTDHRNLQFIFSKSSGTISTHRHTAAKLQRWSLLLMAFEYHIHFIEGENNVWADLLSRWGIPKPGKENVETAFPVNKVLMMPISPTISKEFIWPTLDHIRTSQETWKNKNEKITVTRMKGKDFIWHTSTGQIWIPNGDINLQLRLCVIAHSGAAGHRGYEATLKVLKEVVFWPSMEKTLKRFLSECLHCLAVGGPFKIPRPFGEQIHSDTPNEILHMDWLYMLGLPSGDQGAQYIHVMLDDTSRFIQLTVANQPTANATADSILQWASFFGFPKVWVSDGATHYINEVLKDISERTSTKHHVTVAYSPWANGTVETMMSQILKVFRAILSEWRMPIEHWPVLVPIVQSALNHAPSARLGGRAPIEVFTGQSGTRPLDSLRHPETKEVLTLKDISAAVELEFQKLQLRRNELHSATAQIASNLRKQARDHHNNKVHIKTPNFTIGDFVLVGALQKSRQKLKVKWMGLRRITKALSGWVFEVENLITKKLEKVHVSRLKFYNEKDLEVTEDIKNQVSYNEDIFEIENIEDIKYETDKQEYQLFIKWKGFSVEENTWEPLEEIIKTAIDTVKDYLSSADSNKIKREAIKWLKHKHLWEDLSELNVPRKRKKKT